MWRLEEQRYRQGGYLYIKDEGGSFSCYYRGCGQKMKEEYGRHIERHEIFGDEIDADYQRTAQSKYKQRSEATIANALRTKSSLRRSKENEISLETCEGILAAICAICDSEPLPIHPSLHSSVCPNRDSSEYTLSNLIFDPLRQKAYFSSNPKNALDLGVVYRRLSRSIPSNHSLGTSNNNLNQSRASNSSSSSIQGQNKINSEVSGNAHNYSIPPTTYKDAEEFATDVRHALAYARTAAGAATQFSPFPQPQDFLSHLRRISSSFCYLMEFERLSKRFELAERKLETLFGKNFELPLTVLTQVLQSLFSSSSAQYALTIDINADLYGIESHQGPIEGKRSISSLCAYLPPYLPQFYRNIEPPNKLNYVYERLRSGDLAVAPYQKMAELCRSFFHLLLLWNEPQSETWMQVDKMANMFENQIEKAMQKATREIHRFFRYSVRDQHNRLLIWDPKRKEYYLEYFVSPSKEWSNVSSVEEEEEKNPKFSSSSVYWLTVDLGDKEYGSRNGDGNPKNHYRMARCISVLTGAWERAPKGIDRFDKPPPQESMPTNTTTQSISSLQYMASPNQSMQSQYSQQTSRLSSQPTFHASNGFSQAATPTAAIHHPNNHLNPHSGTVMMPSGQEQNTSSFSRQQHSSQGQNTSHQTHNHSYHSPGSYQGYSPSPSPSTAPNLGNSSHSQNFGLQKNPINPNTYQQHQHQHHRQNHIPQQVNPQQHSPSMIRFLPTAPAYSSPSPHLQ